MNLRFVEKRSNWPIEKTPVLCCGADCLLTTLDGADFRTSYNWQTGWGDWHASCAGTRELRRRNIPGPGAPLVNLTANDPDLKQVAERKHSTPAQIALAWLLAQKPWIVPIPGTTKRERLPENLGAVDLDLTPDDLREINAAAAKIEVRGARLPEAVLQFSNR
jgi:hypothetical protein